MHRSLRLRSGQALRRDVLRERRASAPRDDSEEDGRTQEIPTLSSPRTLGEGGAPKIFLEIIPEWEKTREDEVKSCFETELVNRQKLHEWGYLNGALEDIFLRNVSKASYAIRYN